jgi:hypothetical protein
MTNAFKFIRFLAVFLATAVLLVAGSQTLRAQTPTPAQISLARELIAVKGSTNIYDSAIPGIVERTKGFVLQGNPMLEPALNEVANKLKEEFKPRATELHDIVEKLYASKFTEQELKDALVFYKSPLGRKIIDEEPKILDESLGQVDVWIKKVSDQIVVRMKEEMKKKGFDL